MVVTGWGAVSGHGWGAEALLPIFDGQTSIRATQIGDLPGAPLIWCSKAPAAKNNDAFGRRTQEADPIAQMSVFAAIESLSMASLNTSDIGMIGWGTGFGGAQTLDKSYRHLLFNRSELAHKVSPLTVPRAMTHASAAAIAAQLEISCPSITYSTACSSAALAITQGANAIRFNQCEVALVGGAESLIVPGVVKAWESMSALAPLTDGTAFDGPFDALRKGLCLGDAAACLVLESESHAIKRGAQVLARLEGYGINTDHKSLTTPYPEPQVQCMLQALKMAGYSPREITYVNAHGTGTLAGDRTEINSLNTVFEDTLAWVSSSKGLTGHTMGASGALEAVILMLCLQRGRIPPNRPIEKVDPCVRFNLAINQEAISKNSIVMSNSFAFGGSNVSLIFKGYFS